MKVAALIQAHHRPDLLERLLQRLRPPLWSCYVHLDAKSDIGRFPFLDRLATPATRRVKVYWAGYAQVAASLILLRQAVADEGNSHFYLMSGQCAPIMPDEAIAARIGAAAGRGDFIDVAPMPSPTKGLDRLTQWHVLERMRYGRARRIVQRGLALLPPRDVERLLHGMAPHAGWSWFLLSRRTAEEMLGFLDREPWYEAAFRHSLCADEMFFQTLFAGLGLVADGGCPTAATWVGNGSHPEPLDAARCAAFRRSGEHMMARKVVDFHPDDRPP